MSHHPIENLPEFTNLINVADPRLGAQTLYATDDFFAAKERILNPEAAVFIDGKYDDNGKWMDGWESRRKREFGHDYLIIKLAKPASINGIDIDTSHFTGNFPSAASLDGINLPEDVADNQWSTPQCNKLEWQEILPSHALSGNSHHYLDIDSEQVFTHLRFNIYPDGGVARLRVYGQIELNSINTDETLDLAAALNGGREIACSDAHFGKPSNMLLPHPAPNMGEGWETRRRREPGYDWCIIELGQAGIVEDIEVDTAYFKGNFPDSVSMQAAYSPNTPTQTLITQSMFWDTLLEQSKLSADSKHPLKPNKWEKPITHVRINMHPDGGISRVRLYGKAVNK